MLLTGVEKGMNKVFCDVHITYGTCHRFLLELLHRFSTYCYVTEQVDC